MILQLCRGATTSPPSGDVCWRIHCRHRRRRAVVREDNAIVQKLIATWTLLGSPRIVTAGTLVEEIRGVQDLLGLGRSISCPWSVSGITRQPRMHPSRPQDVLFFQLTSEARACEVHPGDSRRRARPSSAPAIMRLHRRRRDAELAAPDHVVPILTYHLKDVTLGCRAIQLPTERVLAEPLEWLDSIERFAVTPPGLRTSVLVADRLSQAGGRRWNLSSVSTHECRRAGHPAGDP